MPCVISMSFYRFIFHLEYTIGDSSSDWWSEPPSHLTDRLDYGYLNFWASGKMCVIIQIGNRFIDPFLFSSHLSLYEHCNWSLQNMINLFSFVAWYNIGYINWEPWLPKIFTRLLKSFSLPIANVQVTLTSHNYSISIVATWIVAMMGNGSSCLKYLNDLLTAIKSFYHPSNTGDFQENLVTFLAKLAQAFVDRLHL